ncbi:MAG: NF038143 family protein [Dehalobacterium sp.]
MTKELVITDENYQSILAYENKIAQIITAKVLEKPELSVWMILIPIVFIPFMQRYQKYQESAKTFREGYLFTKKIGLDTAYRIFRKEIALEDAPELITKIVKKNPNADQLVLNIYQMQIQEVSILYKHYLALFASEKVKYRDMVVDYYQTEDNYLKFLKRLSEAEKEVTRAASATFKDGTEEVPEIMEKMEKHLLEIRLKEAKLFFT